MNLIELTYQCVAGSFNAFSAVLSRALPTRRMGKAKRFFMSRRGLLNRIEDTMKQEPRPVYWFHASSLGEYQIARPLMKALRSDNDKAIVLTFFSPTGVDALKGQNPDRTCADYIFPLPLDSRENATRFIRAVKPRVAVFMVAELWFNLLTQLKLNKVPAILVSCLVRNDSRYFKWRGQFQRRMLNLFDKILVHDRRTLGNLYRLGLGDNTLLVGDPLYDNALSIRDSEYHNQAIERFCNNAPKVFVAGSIHYDKDIELALTIANRHPEIKVIIAPHEIDPEEIAALKSRLNYKTVLYSEITDLSELDDAHVLIVDFIGELSRIYRYGTAAYVGGGFTRFIHSVIEPMVYGIPVCFGPCIERKATPLQMVDLGIGVMVCTPDEIDQWWNLVCMNAKATDEIHKSAQAYSEQNRGGSATVVSQIKSLAK